MILEMSMRCFFVKKSPRSCSGRDVSRQFAVRTDQSVEFDPSVFHRFAAGSAFAGMGGLLFGLNYGTINFHDGYLIGLKAFTAAVLGGIGNIPGAMVGGLILGVAEVFVSGYLSSTLRDAMTIPEASTATASGIAR